MQIIIKRKTLTTVVLIAAGVILILTGWLGGFGRSGPGMEKSVKPGTPVVGEEALVVEKESTEVQNTDSVPKSWLKENIEAGGEFFVEYRMERDRVRGQQVEFYREIINNSNTSSDARQLAQNRLLVISQNMEKEMKLENLIRAKGYKDAVVFLHDQTVTAIVRAISLTEEEIAELSAVVARGAGVDEQNIFIMAKT